MEVAFYHTTIAAFAPMPRGVYVSTRTSRSIEDEFTISMKLIISILVFYLLACFGMSAPSPTGNSIQPRAHKYPLRCNKLKVTEAECRCRTEVRSTPCYYSRLGRDPRERIQDLTELRCRRLQMQVSQGQPTDLGQPQQGHHRDRSPQLIRYQGSRAVDQGMRHARRQHERSSHPRHGHTLVRSLGIGQHKHGKFVFTTELRYRLDCWQL